jgi:hypothetical protein
MSSVKNKLTSPSALRYLMSNDFCFQFHLYENFNLYYYQALLKVLLKVNFRYSSGDLTSHIYASEIDRR